MFISYIFLQFRKLQALEKVKLRKTFKNKTCNIIINAYDNMNNCPQPMGEVKLNVLRPTYLKKLEAIFCWTMSLKVLHYDTNKLECCSLFITKEITNFDFQRHPVFISSSAKFGSCQFWNKTVCIEWSLGALGETIREARLKAVVQESPKLGIHLPGLP